MLLLAGAALFIDRAEEAADGTGGPPRGMAVDVAVGCSLCVLLLDLLLKLRMTAFRLSALIARRPTASKAHFQASHVAQLNHAEYAPCLAVLMMAVRYLADRRAAAQPKRPKRLSALSRVGCVSATLSWCANCLFTRLHCGSPVDTTSYHCLAVSCL